MINALSKFTSSINTVVICQVIVSAISAFVLSRICEFSTGNTILMIFATVMYTHMLREAFAPSTGFWKHFPSWFIVCVAIALWVVGQVFPSTISIFVFVASVIFGLGIGRQVAKLA
ncbi:MAG: hypothetical protein P4L53_04000 [Candidatus Obscuribacterales bacterium]|nr:hypothetical protein [Candidatus Obscuribacterales bacterium]